MSKTRGSKSDKEFFFRFSYENCIKITSSKINKNNSVTYMYTLKTVPPNAEVFFFTVYDNVGKIDLSMGYWNPER